MDQTSVRVTLNNGAEPIAFPEIAAFLQLFPVA
jgi:hypothetical protein